MSGELVLAASKSPVVMPRWSAYSVSTITGRIQRRVFPKTFTWARLLNRQGSGSTTFDISADTLNYGSLMALWARKLVLCWDDIPVYSGIINRVTLDESDLTLTVDHADFRSILARRTLLGFNGYDVDGKLILNNTTFQYVAYRLWRLVSETPSGNAALNFWYPPADDYNGPPGPVSREFRDWNGPSLGGELDKLQNTENGPDIDYTIDIDSNGNFRDVARIGPADAPGLTGPALDFVMNASKLNLFGLKTVYDGALMTNDVTGLGNGQEAKRLVATARANLPDVPVLQTILPNVNTDNPQELQGNVNEELRIHLGPTEQVDMSMKASGNPGLGRLVLGQPIRRYYENHRWHGTGWKQNRLIGYSGDLSDDIKLTVQ